MSKPVVIYWPPSTGNFIALTQDVEDGEYIVFGNVPNVYGPHNPDFSVHDHQSVTGVFKYDRMIRSIFIGSTDDLTGVVFTVSGIGCAVDANGNPTTVLRPITEDIEDVDADNVESEFIYSQINSIAVSGGDATNVDVSYGTFGITNYVNSDYNRIIPIASVSVQVVGHIVDGLTYTVNGSLNSPESTVINYYSEVLLGADTVPLSSALEPFGVQIVGGVPTQITFLPTFPLIPNTTDETTFAGASQPFSVIWATVDNTTTDSLYFTVLQQGIG